MTALTQLLFVATALLATPFASAEEKELFDAILGSRVETCKSHYDISNYIAIVAGGDLKPMSMKEIASLRIFYRTGKLLLSVERSGDETAVSCKAFAEGLLAGQMVSEITKAFSEKTSDILAESLAKPLEQIGEAVARRLRESMDSGDVRKLIQEKIEQQAK